MPTRVQILSDLHLEMCLGNRNIVDLVQDNIDVLVLAGDIHMATLAVPKIKEVLDKYLQIEIVYIAGNHEFYSQNLNVLDHILKLTCEPIDRLHFLEKSSVEIGNLVFLGTTMWSSLENADIKEIKESMNDYNCIEIGNRDLVQPHHTHTKFEQAIQWLEQEVDRIEKDYQDKTLVVVTHHLPSFQCIDKKYNHLSYLHPAFASDLDEFIINHPKINTWIHGHTHSPVEITIGNTNVVCNPYGYPRENKDYKSMVIELP